MNNPLEIMQMVTQLKNNPMSMLSQFGVPQSMANNPMQVIQFLMNNGAINQSTYDNAVRQAQSMGFKI